MGKRGFGKKLLLITFFSFAIIQAVGLLFKDTEFIGSLAIKPLYFFMLIAGVVLVTFLLKYKRVEKSDYYILLGAGVLVILLIVWLQKYLPSVFVEPATKAVQAVGLG